MLIKIDEKQRFKREKRPNIFQRIVTDRNIMREKLSVGLYAVIGKQGAGKTSCATAMLCNDWKYHHLERYEETKSYINVLNWSGFNLHLPDNKTIYYSPDKIILSKKPYVETWYIDPLKFKLPNLREEVQYVPRGSVVFLPEFDNIIPCRDWKNMDKYLIALAKYARHWDLVIIIDFQCWLQLDVSWRRLMMYTLFMYDTYTDYRFRLFKLLFRIPFKRRWKYIWCDNQLNAFVKDISDMCVDEKLVTKLKKQVAKDKRYVFRGDIFERFDSTNGDKYFLRGIDDFQYIPHNKIELSPEGVEEYCRVHPIERSKDDAPKIA